MDQHSKQGQGVGMQHALMSTIAFLDYIHFICRSLGETQLVMDEAIAALAQAGLKHNLSKTDRMANR